MMYIRRVLTRAVREILFVIFFVTNGNLYRQSVAGNLQGYRRGYVLTYFSAKRGVFRGIPLTTQDLSNRDAREVNFRF